MLHYDAQVWGQFEYWVLPPNQSLIFSVADVMLSILHDISMPWHSAPKSEDDETWQPYLWLSLGHQHASKWGKEEP